MFHRSRSLRLLAVSLLASALPIGAARADHFKFTVLFTKGTLFGFLYSGYFQTNKPPPGQFTPDAHTGGQLMSLAITIDGAQFLMQDDKDFPYLPRINIGSTGYTNLFDFDASYGSATSPNKWVWIIRKDGGSLVNFGTWRGSTRIVESEGEVYSIVKIDPREAPPDPNCSGCHSQPRR